MSAGPEPRAADGGGTIGVAERVRRYWDDNIHDLAVVRHAVGTPGFFADLDEYRFDKLRYLAPLVDFERWSGRRVLEVGCGAGVDLVRFAKAGAIVSGMDLAPRAVGLAREYFAQALLDADLRVGDASALPWPDETFDMVYGHGVLPYAPDPAAIVEDSRRVLKAGGLALFQGYNRLSWLRAVSALTGTPLEHQDAPVFRMFGRGEFERLFAGFSRVEILYERFPVRTRLHRGFKAILYNGLFVGTFNLLPRAAVRPLGWHLIARGWK